MTTDNINKFKKFGEEDFKEEKTIKIYIRNKKRIKESTLNHNLTVLRLYFNEIEKTPTEAIKTAFKEQKEHTEMIYRTHKNDMLDYYEFMEKKYSPRTLKPRMDIIRNFYKRLGIEVPEEEFNNKIEESKDLVTKKDIRRFMDFADIKYKSIIELMATSGLGGAEVQSLTIKHFLDAINFKEESFTVKDVRDFVPTDYIPIWDVKRIKTGNKYFTFSSSLSVKLILNYLEDRERRKGTLTRDKYLFVVNKKDGEKQLRPKIFVMAIKDIALRAGFKKVGNSNQSTAHKLRGFFASKMTEHVSELYGHWFLGHSIDKITSAYFKPEPEAMFKRYMGVLPLLTTENVETVTIESSAVKEMRKEIADLKAEKEEKEIEFMPQKMLQAMIDKKVKEIMGMSKEERLKWIEEEYSEK